MVSSGRVPLLSALLCACALRFTLGQFLALNRGTRHCTLYRTSVRGTCQSIYDCPIVLKNIRLLRPTFCFFDGRIPFVCCPKPCGTSAVKPAIRILQEVAITRTLNSPSVRSLFPKNLGFAPGNPSRQFPAVRVSSIDDLGVNFLIAEGIDSEKNSWPWMALLGYGSKKSPEWKCDGVLINNLWVLTAAHCVIMEFASVVRLGEHDLATSKESPHADFGIKDTVFHPNYDYPKGYQDLALLKLDRPVKIKNEIRPVCLPWGEQEVPSIGSTVTLTGWGRTSFGGNRSNILQEASVHMLNREECVKGFSTLHDYSSRYPRGITSDLLCIGDTDGEGQDACQGDSGGPVVIREDEKYVLVGIVSLGYGCSNPDFPGVYASAHHPSDLAWIKKVAF
ncbi:venom protease-like isoform X2 [Oratosquilla oratoria]|uniref:venom protease-like isoform X2 n=1 Tax=Oratosquilla oratoria TaxID=337810 RepID=UPI003F76E2D6